MTKIIGTTPVVKAEDTQMKSFAGIQFTVLPNPIVSVQKCAQVQMQNISAFAS